MPAHRKRTHRQRGAPDPVAERISADLEGQEERHTSPAKRGRRAEEEAPGRVRYAVNSAHVDRTAGEEYVQQRARPSSDDNDDT
jgi:hypothetical protein